MLAHQHGDLTATIEAGATLRDVNDALSRHGQWLPLDPPFADEATIGGILATNDSGPLRHRYGTPRDLVIGVQLATTDGVLDEGRRPGRQERRRLRSVQAGRRIVRQPGGDRQRHVQAVADSRVVEDDPVSRRRTSPPLAQAVRTVMATQLDPMAFEVAVSGPSDTTHARARGTAVAGRDDGLQLLLRFASVQAAVDAQVAAATEALNGIASVAQVVEGYAERTLWRRYASRLWERPGAIVRASWLPAIGAGLGDGRNCPRAPSWSAAPRSARAWCGSTATMQEQARVIEMLRHSPHFGNVVIAARLRGAEDARSTSGDRRAIAAGCWRR